MLADIRKQHLAAWFKTPCDNVRVRKAKQVFRVAALYRQTSHKTRSLPLPSAVTSRMAGDSHASCDRARRRRPTAVVTQFWLLRRAGDVTVLRVCDMEVHPNGSMSYEVPRHKTEATGVGSRISHTMPAGTNAGVDLPHVLQSRVLAHLPGARGGPTARLFTQCAKPAAAGTMTASLLERLRLLGVSRPVGRHCSSHSCRSGGAASERAAGCRRDACGISVPTIQGNRTDPYPGRKGRAITV